MENLAVAGERGYEQLPMRQSVSDYLSFAKKMGYRIRDS